MKKRVISFFLAVALILIMTLPVSAATYETTQTYDGCTYHTFNYCTHSSFQSLIELSDCSGDAADYVFFVRADVYFIDERGYMRMYDRYENQSIYIASVTGTIDVDLYSAVCTQKINDTTIFSLKPVYAS